MKPRLRSISCAFLISEGEDIRTLSGPVRRLLLARLVAIAIGILVVVIFGSTPDIFKRVVHPTNEQPALSRYQTW